MEIRDWNPAEGCAFQGDVAIIPIPDGIAIDTTDEIRPVAGRLILQEGELTGHHHAITLADPRAKHFRRETEIGDPLAADRLLAETVSRRMPRASTPAKMRAIAEEAGQAAEQATEIAKAGTARMYRDRVAAAAMVSAQILERSDLMTGFLIVEGGPVVVQHEEHDGIRVPPGRFYVGRQVESAGAEERRVTD